MYLYVAIKETIRWRLEHGLIIAFYLKRESIKIEKLSTKLREMEINLAKNSARDEERWDQTTKLLEDRRQDTIKIYEKINR